jgi:hypothetical protein
MSPAIRAGAQRPLTSPRRRGISFEMPRRKPFLSSRRSRSVSASGDRLGKNANFRDEDRSGERNESNTPRERRAIQRAAIHRGTKRMDKSIRSPLSRVRTKDSLERDLERVQDAWDDCQTDRRCDAIYGYLQAVYDLVTWWSADSGEVDRARQALRLRGLLPCAREGVYAAIIRCTSDPARMDKRTRSKWSRVLRYATMQKDEREPLAAFIKRKGGINECNATYRRCLGEQAKIGVRLRTK